MSAPTRRRRSSPRSLRPAVAAGVLGIGLLLSSAFAGVTIQANALDRRIGELGGELSSEQARNASLQAAGAEKKSSDYVIEKAKQFGWVWPWEAIIAVQRDANARAQMTPVSERPSRIERWIALFVGAR
jgi:hypothetical protein